MPWIPKTGLFRDWPQDAPEELPTPDVIALYENGFAGATYSEADWDDFYKSMMFPDGEAVCHQFNLADTGAGKLVIPFVLVIEMFPGCWPGRQGQARGDCVSWSTKNGGLETMVCDIVSGKPDEKTGIIEGKPDVPEAGIADGVLNTESIYWFRGYNGDGWHCPTAAKVVCTKGGLMLRQNYPDLGFDLTNYSGRNAGLYGSRAPGPEIQAVTSKHLVHQATNCNSFEAIRDMLFNGYGISTCGGEGLSNKRDENGVSKRSGSWAHAMCYSSDTDILTSDGWKPISEMTSQDILATLNPLTHCLEWEKPLAVHAYDFSGDLLRFAGQSLDVLVTPNHRMYGIKSSRRKPKAGGLNESPNEFEFIRADECASSFMAKKTAGWEGEEVEWHELSGGTKIPMDLWLEFLGYYIAEGHVYRRDYDRVRDSGNTVTATLKRTSIAQRKAVGVETIGRCLERMPYNFRRVASQHRWDCDYKELYEELESLGKSGEKHIPDYVWMCSRRQLRILFDALMIGDGCSRKNGEPSHYITASKRLADDFQRLLLQVGLSGNVRRHAPGKNSFSKREWLYYVTVRSHHHLTKLHNASPVPYTGKVYCPTTTNGIVFVRRNGKAVWCGNSYIGADDRDVIKQVYGEPLVLDLNSWAKWNSGPRDIYQSAAMVPAHKKQEWIAKGIVNPATGNIMIPEGSCWVRYSEMKRRECIAFSGVNGYPAKNLPLPWIF